VRPDTAPSGAVAAPDDAYLDIAGVSKHFRATRVLAALDLTVARGELLSLLGPSGCGKTTLLRILAGLTPPDTGRIRLGGRDLGRIPAHKRNVGVVFQSYALFPHLTVADNIAFGLRAKRTPRGEIAARVAQSLAMIRLEALAERPIAALSGGQQQRIAVARALAVTPDLILLDEPLSALDRKLREVMQVELRRLLRDLGMTAIFVTHDQDEALVLSDRIAVMNEGRIEQIDVPERIYARPATPFVLDFVGTSARLRGKVVASSAGRMTIDCAAGRIAAPGNIAVGTPTLVAIRPEKIELGPPQDAGWNGLDLTVEDQVFLGSKRVIYFAAAGEAKPGETKPGETMLAELPDAPPELLVRGASASIRWRVADTLTYPLS
jgi:putative spermidine/putrescine transport system ATP-binding protein